MRTNEDMFHIPSKQLLFPKIGRGLRESANMCPHISRQREKANASLVV